MQKHISTLAGIIIIVAVAVLSFGGVFAYQYFNKYPFKTGPLITNQNSKTPEPTLNETADWKTYTNGTLNYEFKYPKDFISQDVGKYQTDDYVFRACNPQNTVCLYSNIIRYKQPSFNDYVKLFTNPTIPINNPNLKTLYSYVMEVASKKCFVLETSVTAPDKEYRVIDAFIDYNQPILIQMNISGEKEIGELQAIYDKVISTFKFTK